MSKYRNQHYVPQYYFRNFTGGNSVISILLTQSGRIVPSGPIRGQCSKHNFYGSSELECAFGQLESTHRVATNEALEFTWGESCNLSEESRFRLLQAIVFQRFRTPHEAERYTPALMDLLLDMFRQHLLHEGKTKLVKVIDAGAFHLSEELRSSPKTSVVGEEIFSRIRDLIGL